MKQYVLGIITILIFTFLSALVYAQESLVFSAIEQTRPVKTVGEVLRRAYQKIGIRIEILELPGIRALKYSDGGETDGEVCRKQGIEKEYTNLIPIDVAVTADEMFLFVKRGNEFEFEVDGWESIPKGTVIGYQRGVKFVEKNTMKYSIEAHDVRSADQLFTMLDLGRVGAVISGSEMGSKVIKEHNLQEIVRLNPQIHTAVLYHYLHKKHAHLVPEITAVLKEMKDSGELQKIMENQELSQSKK